ncbi:MAG: adenosylhomocysteinase [Hadesarchaea archaeon]|nr:MAG: adenosylhomocysteinase [Hadesarchaea archaeon]
MRYRVRNLRLAPRGRAAVEWAREHMPVLAEIRREFSRSRPLRGLRVGAALHVEAKTAVLALTLKEGGAEVSLAGCNPLSTKDEVAAALVKEGVSVYAWRGESQRDYYANLRRVIADRPDLVIDDGGDLVSELHSRGGMGVKGGCEETTTGVNRLRAMEARGELRFPVIAVNDSPTKRLFDNRFGTAESTLQALMSLTNTQIGGKRVVVVGYGHVGRGIASRARGLGAVVTVVETDPVRALEAAMDGFLVRSLEEACEDGEIFITATGSFHVIREEHLREMRDGAILCNAGHFNVEIDLEALRRLSERRREVLEDVEEFRLKGGKRLYLLAGGRLVNLAGRRSLGHPMEIMDLSFSLQALSLQYLAGNADRLKPGVHEVPPEIDRRVAELKLKLSGIRLERQTEEQREYLRSWRMGT